MLAFILRRILQSALVMLVVAFIAFGLFTYTGDPVTFMVGQDATQEQRAQLRSDLGLDQPFYMQFGRFVGRALHGEFGLSLRQGRPVATLLKERLPATLELALTAALLALLLGIPAGVYTALRRNSWFAQFLLTVSLAGISLPTFLIGILLILVFAVMLGWLPSFGRGETVALGWWTTGFLTKSGLKALILPSITLSLFQMTLIMRLVRAEMLEVLRTDYIKFARARGLTDRTIHFGHALKNTLVPVIDDHRAAAGRSSPLPSSPRPCFSGRGWGCCSSGRELCRCAGDGRVSVLHRTRVRADQSHRGPALLRGRSACASSASCFRTALHAIASPPRSIEPVDHLRSHHVELTALRRDLHAHPELGFEEHRTARRSWRASWIASASSITIASGKPVSWA